MTKAPKHSEDTPPSASTFKPPRTPWTIAKRLLLAVALGFGALHLFPAGWDLLYAARADQVVAAGVVDQATGDTKVKPGERCKIVIDPDFKAGFNCRVDVECGGRPLWGGKLQGGYVDCVTRDRRFVRGHHKDSDAHGGHTWLAFDLEEGSLRLNDIQSDVHIRIERSRPADAPPAPSPSAAEPPGTPPGPSARRQPDYATSIPGVLTLRSDEAGLAPADRAQPMRVLGARARVIGRGYAINFRRPHKIPP